MAGSCRSLRPVRQCYETGRPSFDLQEMLCIWDMPAFTADAGYLADGLLDVPFARELELPRSSRSSASSCRRSSERPSNSCGRRIKIQMERQS
ncbi:hypothetical protein OsI_15003 [Oryza sativa Indica Group]|uniref:Uncharacterized protein n=1 Tax=Oryza sativa subsp. indica TaxID=39946 RepID=B8AVS4_ORYSI|nr:hypothetical protein OsI_15003 [Oryza sativa Indica Group]